MIKFFRRIRQQLLGEGKTGKYLKYALGEILLVMIGILLALQVNNWNEGRKDRIEEREILFTLKEDFQNTILEIERLNGLRQNILKVTDTFYKITRDGFEGYSKSELDSLFSIIIINPTLNVPTSSLSLLFSTGKLNLIRSNHIRDILLKWPILLEDMLEGESYASNELRDLIRPKLEKYLNIQNINKWMKWRDLDMSIKENHGLVKSDYKGLFKDVQFINYLSRRELELNINVSESEELKKVANELINLINKLLQISE